MSTATPHFTSFPRPGARWLALLGAWAGLGLILVSAAAGQEERSTARRATSAVELYNTLNDLLVEGKVEDAVPIGQRLHALEPTLFDSFLHQSLASSIKRDERRPDTLRFLESLDEKGKEPLSAAVGPLLLATRAKSSDDPKEVEDLARTLESLLEEGSNYAHKTERYGLFVLGHLKAIGSKDAPLAMRILKKVIKNLESDPSVAPGPKDRAALQRRAWHRYLLAYSYNLHALWTIDGRYVPVVQSNAAMENIGRYSPDGTDQLHRQEYCYDGWLLHEGDAVFSYWFKYVNYLEGSGRIDDALVAQAKGTLASPSEENFDRLSALHTKAGSERSLKEYWHDYIHSEGQAAPGIELDFDGDVIDLSQPPGRWLYLDFWGTWCAPCIRELPHLQQAFDSNDPKTTGLEILSLSFRSSDLGSFMKKNDYTFPVAEVNEDAIKGFQVLGYPTHVLVTPGGHFVTIDRQVSIETILETYVMHRPE